MKLIKIFIFVLFYFPSLVIAKDVWLDDDGAEAAAAGITVFKKTPAEAMAAAFSGDTIKVLPGTYPKITITKSVALVAMKDGVNRVNPTNDPENASWPVVVESNAGNGIELWGQDKVLIQGFYVRNTTKNGIHAAMGGGAYNFRNLCEDVSIVGNKVETVDEDAIKVNQCNRVTVSGNVLNDWSRRRVRTNTGESEHAIDFVAVGNSIIRNNKILKGLLGITVKGGSINVLVENNNVVGPLTWVGLAAGETGSREWAFYSSYEKEPGYQAKFITARNNTFPTGITFWSCQSCTAVNNKGGAVGLTQKGTERTLDVCVTGSKVNKTVASIQLKSSDCQTSWPGASKRFVSGKGWDMHAGSGELPPAL